MDKEWSPWHVGITFNEIDKTWDDTPLPLPMVMQNFKIKSECLFKL